MDTQSELVFDYLKGRGKVSGGSVREALGLSRPNWDSAKAELKSHGLVALGRGRGGTIELISEDKPVEREKITKEQRMAFAREEKAARSKTQKELNEKTKQVEAFVRGQFPKDTKFWVEVHPATLNAIVYVWGTWENNEEYWKPYRVTL